MRYIQLLAFIMLGTVVMAQSNTAGLEKLIRQVENSLTPNIIYGDTIPNLNLQERMKATGIQGLSIAVIKDYKIHWAKGYGMADVAENRPVTNDTRFQAASISKSLNSMGQLKLVQQGKVDGEADINQSLKSWKFPYDSITGNKKVTLYQLLSHTAGLDIHGFPGYKRTDTLPTIVQILNGEKPANTKKVKSLFAAGTKFKYSGGGTTVSQLLLQDVTGEDYARFMEREVLKHLGMTNSSYMQPPKDTANLATGYYGNGQPVKAKYHVYPEQAAAGLWTTPTDLAKYIIECQWAIEGKSAKVLNRDMMQKRMTPYIDSNAALGVFIEKRGDIKWFNHNGGNEAFLCTSYGSLEGGHGVVIMINGENFSVISELLNSVARVYNWQGFFKPEFRKKVIPPADTLKAMVGNYKVFTDTITLKLCDEGLCIQQNGEPVNGYACIFSDNITFSMAEVPNAGFKVLFNEAGKVIALELKQAGMTMKLPRIE
ncbi:MAG: beta-lactamase family protein [Chitinophagaceae bacterium]|nr:beta-lactamase family protein [Chitinophagaceae bacterium]